ncbi:hypothetical protein CBER1_03109 [Cercospora berteroae]|uniref:Uncharacterized protein n=1 Tax=Cercospora berteroae TaxID=357750 RepID=A0A2S6CK33_9PEZI|nr:hypothetical protein CBER1_03109 [Cercospora berteroae]
MDAISKKEKYRQLLLSAVETIDQLKELVEQGDPARAQALECALAADEAAIDTMKSAYAHLADGNQAKVDKDYKHAVACHNYSRALVSMPGYLSDSFTKDVEVIAKKPADSIQKATEDHKKKCQDMERAMAARIPVQSQAEYEEGLERLAKAYEEHADDLKEPMEAYNRAVAALFNDN